MIRAYVLATAAAKQDKSVVEALRRLEHVTDVSLVYGKYDIVITIDAESLEQVKAVVLDGIRGAFSSTKRRKKDHLASCGTCSGFLKGDLTSAALPPAEARHVLDFLKFYSLASDPLKSTLTLVCAGEGAAPVANSPVAQRRAVETQK